MHLQRNIESSKFAVSSEGAVGHLSQINERALQWFSINLVTITEIVFDLISYNSIFNKCFGWVKIQTQINQSLAEGSSINNVNQFGTIFNPPHLIVTLYSTTLVL